MATKILICSPYNLGNKTSRFLETYSINIIMIYYTAAPVTKENIRYMSSKSRTRSR